MSSAGAVCAEVLQKAAHGNILPLSPEQSWRVEMRLLEGVSQTRTRTLFEGLECLEMECATSVSDTDGYVQE